MNDIFKRILQAEPFYQDLEKTLLSGYYPISVTGVSGVHKAHTAFCLSQHAPLLLICADAAEEERRRRQSAAEEREKRRQQAILKIQKRFGKNAIFKGMNLQEGATTIARNGQIGGHKA